MTLSLLDDDHQLSRACRDLGGRRGVSGVGVTTRLLRGDEAARGRLCRSGLLSLRRPGIEPSALQQRAVDAAPIELRVGFATARRRLRRPDPPARNLYRPRAGRRGGARKPAGGARGAGDRDSHLSRWAIRDRHRADGFDLCDQTHCQVVRTATAATTRAAQATAGQVLMRNGAIASGVLQRVVRRAHRDSVERLARRRRSALSAVADDDACEGAPAWEAELRPADLLRAFRAAGFRGNRLRDMRIVSRNSSGRVARLRLDGLTPPEISGQDLRVVVGRTLGWQHIKSTAFELRLAWERVPVRRPRLRPRRRHVRDRLDQPRRARDERDGHPSEVFSRGRHRGCRRRRASAPPSAVLVSLPDDDEGERGAVRGSPPWPATSSPRRWALPRHRG